MQSEYEVKSLSIKIPAVPSNASFTHHPIVRTAKFYRLEELADVGTSNTEWVGFFEEILCGLFWKLEEAVPYAFRTPDGTFRNLDAGCLKFLANRNPPHVTFCCDPDGYIDAVTPTRVLLNKHLSGNRN